MKLPARRAGLVGSSYRSFFKHITMDKFKFPIIREESGCGCGAAASKSEDAVPTLDQAFVTGSIDIPAGRLPQVSSALRLQDHWGTVKARFGVGRMDYSINPGLYALCNPDENSPVFVSANYKMSFDRLREALPGRAFSLKGFSVGIVIALILLYLRDIHWQAWPGRIEALAWLLIIPAVSAYLAMNFTGCSTYTSLSGVKREMRFALPLEIAFGAAGLVLWIGALWIA
jgi:hypothetical protein